MFTWNTVTKVLWDVKGVFGARVIKICLHPPSQLWDYIFRKITIIHCLNITTCRIVICILLCFDVKTVLIFFCTETWKNSEFNASFKGTIFYCVRLYKGKFYNDGYFSKVAFSTSYFSFEKNLGHGENCITYSEKSKLSQTWKFK